MYIPVKDTCCIYHAQRRKPHIDINIYTHSYSAVNHLMHYRRLHSISDMHFIRVNPMKEGSVTYQTLQIEKTKTNTLPQQHKTQVCTQVFSLNLGLDLIYKSPPPKKTIKVDEVVELI